MSGISYSELKAMDLYDFAEAEQARILWGRPSGIKKTDRREG